MKSSTRRNRPRLTLPWNPLSFGSKRRYHRPHAKSGLRKNTILERGELNEKRRVR